MEIQEKVAALGDLFSPQLTSRIARDLALEQGHWVYDPDVDGVVGFQIRNKLGIWETVVVVYLREADFDCNALYADGVEL